MICERGRRSVTLGRDAVGWLSFSVDVTTASKSTSEQKRTHTKRMTIMQRWEEESKLRSVQLTGDMWPVRDRIWCRSPTIRFGAATPEQVNHNNIRPCMVWHIKMLSVSMMLWVLTLVWVVSRDAVVDGRKRRSLILGGGVSWEGEMGGRA